MKNYLSFFFSAFLCFQVLVGCSPQAITDDEMTLLNASTTTMETADYSVADVVGIWKMSSMSSVNTTVDFDQDGTRTNDLLLETDCFDPMFFDFKSSGDVSTHQSRLYFNASTGMFTCQTTGTYPATYVINGNQVTFTFSIDGVSYTETKEISLYMEGGAEYMKITLTKEETNSAVYVADDPGNTVASDLQEIEMIYRKQ